MVFIIVKIFLSDEELVSSTWEENDEGRPPRKVYSLTGNGKEAFRNWVTSKEENRQVIPFDFFQHDPFLKKLTFFQHLEQEIFSEEYLLARPLLQSIASPHKNVLLIDEIDKVDFEFEAMLLELLSEFQVTLPEMGTYRARHIPFVFLTSNATRELSEALKRRCFYLYLSFPPVELEKRILELKVPDLHEILREKVVRLVQELRKLDLKKPPSIAESIDWASSLVWLAREDLDRDIFEETASVLLKYQEDVEKARNGLVITERGVMFKNSGPGQGWR